MTETYDDALLQVLAPVSIGDFFNHNWEQDPMHVSRNDETYFADILRLQQIEELLSCQELSFPAVQLSRKSNPIAASEYTDEAGRIIPYRLIGLHHEGATIVISQAHRNIPSLSRFKSRVQSQLEMRCQTNLYCSPLGAQGFNAHYDSHDVFILQVQGSKTFNFYEGGVELPYAHEGFKLERHVPGPLAHSVELQPGDTLYIPRGVMHDAVANDASSLHITLGVYAITQRDILLEMAEALTESDPKFRRSMPAALGADSTTPHLQSKARISEDATFSFDLKPFLENETWQIARDRLVDRVALDGAQDCQGMLSTSCPELTPNCVVRLIKSRAMTVSRQGNVVRCRLSGQVLEFTDPMAQALEQLLQVDSVSLMDLQGLDDEQKLALCTPLIQANLLEVVNPQ